MERNFIVKKVLNNNVIIAKDNDNAEVVLIGKGIGFNKKKDDHLPIDPVEKIFVLKDEEKQEQYKLLLPYMDEKLMGIIQQAIFTIGQSIGSNLNEQIHISLTDHLLFAIIRIRKGFSVDNPFLYETRAMYPDEFAIAMEVVNEINKELDVKLPIEEAGFITLHIVSALAKEYAFDVNKYSQIMKNLIEVIEESMQVKLDRSSINYIRLVRHLRFLIERIIRNEPSKESQSLSLILKNEYPESYSLAWKIVKSLQTKLQKPVSEAEVIYLTMHLERLIQAKN
ncbi:PRD domain-containing protein [Bacillus sp. RG28]|uniref:PRD domain-containing protein n=1 Tax=Gottfriedia endophytica TaxID=2820819 RepID=A0A940NTR7_9BACI|nr:PRD domain-containing protein [Gottfriedia endophytica]MBP0724708.1 PRD domain-containing protein [Gottfriedia endophytica]